MATPQEYTVGANALVAEMEAGLAALPEFERDMIRNYLTAARENAMAGRGAKACIDAVDAFRAKESKS